MAVCSRCHRDWPDQYWVCPQDGTVLTAARTASGEVITAPIGIPREEDLRPGTMIGEYRVEGKLGEGGMATVFSATHPLIGKKVAIKVISRRLCADLHAVERFIGEARTVNQIGHPNLVDIFAFGVLPDGRAYLVMEWLQGETLGERMARERLPVHRALDVLIQLCDALEAVHEKGIVHRDLKPHNIFVLERADKVRVKLLDFGIAKLADSDASVPKTRSGVAMGTAGYMSPEQARGKNVDHRTDIYALGCVAYEMLLGRLPFVADTAIDILAMHLAAAPPSPRTIWPTVPAGLDRMLVQMLAKEPDLRPSLQQVRAVFDAAARSITPTMGVPEGPRPQREVGWLRWVGVGAVGAVTVAAGVYGYLTTRAQTGTAPNPIVPALSPPTVAPSATVAPSPHDKRAGNGEAPAAAGAPSERPGPQPSHLVVHAPAGSHVSVDGDEHVVDGGPLTVDVAGGEHRVVVAAPHALAWTQKVRVAAGATAEVHLALKSTHLGKAAPAASAPAATQQPGAQAADKPAEKGTGKPAEPPAKKHGDDYTLDPF